MKKLSLWTITALITFSVGLGAVLGRLSYDREEMVEIEPVPLIDNSSFKSKSFPGLSREISKLPKGKSGYFPQGTWKGYDAADDFMNDWYGTHLRAAGERSLLKVSTNDSEVYRFLWLRSFHHPVFVRVERTGNSIRLISIELNGKGGYEPGTVLRKVTRSLDAAEWSEFLSLLEQSAYWRMPNEEQGSTGVDGAQWILEGVKDNRYHIVDRWSPGEKSNFGAACGYLLELSGIDADRLKDDLY